MCLAPSIGHEGIPSEWVGFYTRYLSGFSRISVRESHWVDQIQRFAPRALVTQLIDPTLMLDRGEWEGLLRSPITVRGYLLVYELGQLSAAHWEYIETLARANHLRVEVLSGQRPDTSWASDAPDFLNLVSGADCIVTDSFHGCVFSFLFDKPMVIVRRDGFAAGMNSRIDTLVEILHLEDRLMECIPLSDAMSHDYDAGRVSLSQHRQRFSEYLMGQGLHLNAYTRGIMLDV